MYFGPQLTFCSMYLVRHLTLIVAGSSWYCTQVRYLSSSSMYIPISRYDTGQFCVYLLQDVYLTTYITIYGQVCLWVPWFVRWYLDHLSHQSDCSEVNYNIHHHRWPALFCGCIGWCNTINEHQSGLTKDKRIQKYSARKSNNNILEDDRYLT